MSVVQRPWQPNVADKTWRNSVITQIIVQHTDKETQLSLLRVSHEAFRHATSKVYRVVKDVNQVDRTLASAEGTVSSLGC